MNQAGLRGLRMPRSRGALSGLLLIVLGAWGALAPFVGPHLHFAYTPDQPWTWTATRGWLEVLPGAVTVLGGVVLVLSANRATAMMGGWMTVLGGAWLIVGHHLAPLLRIGEIGEPVASTQARRVLIELAYFPALGALIVFLGGVALGTLSVVSVRDVEKVRASQAVQPTS